MQRRTILPAAGVLRPLRAQFLAVTVAAVAASTGVAARADNWPVAVGGNPARYSLSRERGPDAATVLWDNKGLSAVIAQQAAADGNLLVMARIYDLGDTLNGTDVVAHDLTTGDKLWNVQLPIDFPASDWRSRLSGVRDGRVYATRAGNTNASYVYALSPVDGGILWKSDDRIIESTTESVTYAPDGDLITTGKNALNQDTLIRIDSVTGDTVWNTRRTCPTTGGCDAAVFDDHAYYWEAGASGPKISVIDIDTGIYLYSSPGIVGGFVQQVAPFCGPDGTVYAPRYQNNPVTDFLVAFTDTGSALVENWRTPLNCGAFASFAVGPDGSVYSYGADHQIVRLDPATGVELDRSEDFASDFFQPRMAVGCDGILYVTNGGFSQGRLYSYNPDLTTRWTRNITNVNVGGPVIGQGGVVVVCGVGTDVRAYQTTPAACPNDPNGTLCDADATGDCMVENADLQAVLDGWAATIGTPRYDCDADFNHDGQIENADLQAVLDDWANHCN